MNSRIGWAWIGLTAALAFHIADEAAHDFLSIYNPNAQWIRARFGLPIPVFSFDVWLTLLIVAVIALLGLSTFAFRGGRWIVKVGAIIFAVLMLLNGANHVSYSLLKGIWMPGVYSSPALIAGSIWLLRERLHVDPIAAETHS